MRKEIQQADNSPLFGQQQAILAAILLFAGILLAFLLLVLSNGQLSMAELLSNRVTASNHSWLDIGLWVLELACYFAVAYIILSGKVLFSFGGMILGVILRLFISFLTAILLHNFAGETLSSMFVAMDNEIWILRVPAIITAASLLALPGRRLLVSGFGLENKSQPKKIPAERAKSFNFSNARHETVGNHTVKSSAVESKGRDDKKCSPPEGFTPLPPLAGVNGTVNISHKVIFASVPDAEPYLLKDYPVRVRKAYIVPQLRNATVWLTWQQVFPGGADDLNYIHADRPDTHFQGHWIRIPAKEYVMQMDMEAFVVKTPAPPIWMQRPEVPQEAQFDVIASK